MRARGTGSVHRRPGRAAWYIKYYDQQGRPHRESSGSAVRADAERLLRRRLGKVADGRRLVGRERERTTFDDLERLIVDDYRLRRRKSLDSVLQSFRALRRGGFGGRRVCDIGCDDLVRYAAAQRMPRARHGKARAGLAPSRHGSRPSRGRAGGGSALSHHRGR